MKIGVAICTYKRSHVINRCIKQVLENLDVSGFEGQVSVYDDGSPIPVEEVIDIDDSRIKLVRSDTNGGIMSHARQTAIDLLDINWDYLWTFDDENLINKEYLKKSINVYQKLIDVNAKPGLISGQDYLRLEQFTGKPDLEPFLAKSPIPEAFPWRDPLGGWIVSKEAWFLNGPINLDINYIEDVE